jgi:hypothetical protein
MAGISDNLEEFRKLSQKHYMELIEGLEDKYCWKCPMRTNSSEAFCREVDSWVRLSGAFEMGVFDHMKEMGIPSNCLEIIAAKMLEKKMGNNHTTPKFQKLVFFKVGKKMEFGVDDGNFLLVKESPNTLKNGDLILLPRSCPLSTFWFSKISYMNDMPLKIFKVEKVFHKGGVKYIKTIDNLEIPVGYVYGLILKIIDENNPIFSDLRLNEIR